MIRVRVRVRVTKLVYQIRLTTFFRSQERENILPASSKQAAASSSKQEAANELISAYPHISINIDGQTFMVDSPSDNIQTHKLLGRNSPRDRVSGQKKS